ncbi:MAG: 5-bromo-4-chloroindolyl phosphate hydrolysis family protein [Pseudoflavonifractor sp.]
MAKVVKKSVAPIYAVALLWIVWAILFPLYAPLHYILAVAASLVVFVLGKAIWPDKTFQDPKVAEQPEKTEKKPEPKAAPKTTGDPELDKLIKQRDLALSEMRRLNDNIADEKISAQIDHLEVTTQKIIQVVVENPQKLPQIRKFLSYYLPTTLKLLNAYDRMDSTGVSGVNIGGTMGKIETMMDTVVTAFDRQLDGLFGEEALDISTDITVLENLLAQEGLGGTQLGSN